MEDEGAYANIALPAVLERSDHDERDRALITDLVYGTVRMRRACDFLVRRFLVEDPPPAAMRALLLGCYQLAYRDDVPAYAAVSSTVGAAPKRYRGLVNAVLRKVAAAPVEFPDPATELSYPDWILERLVADHGREPAIRALGSMNEPARTHRRPDGYVQDLASQWVVEILHGLLREGPSGSAGRVVELCAAPGGKSTALAGSGHWVAALDKGASRVELLRSNLERLACADVAPVRADAAAVPFAPAVAGGVLVDAPCSGLGVLRRLADARWRVDPDAPERLSRLQRSILDEAIGLVEPGGILAYSVCTLTASETTGVDSHLASLHPELEPLQPPGPPWEPWGRGAILMPDAVGTDGMALFTYRRVGGGSGTGAAGHR
ncbi:MAG: transcription antitermination factor NusB [Microthrixaceae bacterium]